MFNEAELHYDDGNFQSHVATFVHEVLHALYFHPGLFEQFPKNKAGESFMYDDSNGTSLLRGDSILEQIRGHFDCSTVNGGKQI